MNGPVTMLLVFAIVGLSAAAVRIGSVERRQRLRREARLERQAQAEWAALQRELAPKSPRLFDLAGGRGDGYRPDTPESS